MNINAASNLLTEVRYFIRNLRLEASRALGKGFPSLSEVKVLRRLKQAPCKAKDIAEELGSGAPYATAVIRKLEAQNWLARVENQADRRSVKLSITATGRQILTRSERVLETTLESRLSRLNKNERAQFAEFLRRLNA